MKITPTQYANTYVSMARHLPKNQLADLTKKFWQLVWRRKHFGWRKVILTEVARLQQIEDGIKVVEVASARLLDAKQQKNLREQLHKVLGTEVSLNNIIKPHLLAGVILTIGDRRLDASFKGRLDNLYRHLAGTIN